MQPYGDSGVNACGDGGKVKAGGLGGHGVPLCRREEGLGLCELEKVGGGVDEDGGHTNSGGGVDSGGY